MFSAWKQTIVFLLVIYLNTDLFNQLKSQTHSIEMWWGFVTSDNKSHDFASARQAHAKLQ